MPKYRFDEIAINSTEKKKPVEADKDTYIGLEHLDSGCLEVTRWGADVAPIGDKLVMRKGDVLFGRRRAYQKKVAIAPFDGIFSAHGMVLRPMESVISKEFFPFFISSDYFLDAAIKISVGSLSPTINWRDLAKLEFEIPTLDEQEAISGILWAMNRLKVAYTTLLQQADALVQSQFVEMFGERFATCRIKLEQIASSTIGLTYKPENTSDSEGTIVLRSGNIQDGELNIKDDIVRVAGIVIPDNKYVYPGDILMCSRNGSASLVGKCCRIPECEEAMAFGAFMTVIRSQYPSFLYGFFQSQYFKEQLTNVGTTSINQITTKMLNAYETVMPTVEEENRFSLLLRETDKSKYCLQRAQVSQMKTARR